jgi:alanine racemase
MTIPDSHGHPAAEPHTHDLPHLTYCEIDQAAIRNNYRRLTELVGPATAVMAVVKANGYGHGACEVAGAAVQAGAGWLGVSSPSEGVALRHAGLAARILVLGCTPALLAEDAVGHYLDLTVYDAALADEYNAAARRLGHTARVHVKVDTGMGRLGVLPQETLEFIRYLHGLGNLSIEAVFTHFSSADSADLAHARRQLQTFNQVLAALNAAGLRPPLVHAANSAGTLSLPEARFDLVRSGILLCGLNPSGDVPCPAGYQPALAWKTSVAQVKTLPPGHAVSYGNTYITQGYERIAVVPAGYADGFRRGVPNEALVRGRRVPVVGRVCMDQCMLAVTGLEQAAIGDEVVLIGRQGQEIITADEVGQRWRTIGYEVICGISARVSRFVTGGRPGL